MKNRRNTTNKTRQTIRTRTRNEMTTTNKTMTKERAITNAAVPGKNQLGNARRDANTRQTMNVDRRPYLVA